MSTDEHVDDQFSAGLASFAPNSLSAGQWLIARDDVLHSVAAVPGLSERDRRVYASRLCQFLAVAGWDRLGPPNLRQLLTAEGIESAVSPQRMPECSERTRARLRTDLRRIGRSLGSVSAPASAPRSHGWTSTQQMWMAVRTVAVPFVALAAAYESSGRKWCPTMWTGFGDQLAAGGAARNLSPVRINEVGPPTVLRPGLSDAVPSVVCAARSLRDVNDCDPQAVTSMAPTKSTPRAKRPISPTGRARAARSKLKAIRASDQSPSAVTQESLPDVDADVAATIDAYRPRGFTTEQWTRIAPVVRVALRAYGPTSSRWVHNQAGQVTGFVAWVAQRHHGAGGGQEFTADLLLGSGLVDRYLADALADAPDASRATVRSTLRRVVRNLSGSQRERIEYTPVQAPYTPAECAAFVRLARNQPSKDLRRALSAMVALGLGAGLDGGDQREVTPADIVDTDLGDGTTGLLVHVRGRRPRAVVVRSTYEPLLREALDLHNTSRRGKHTPIYGLSKARRNVTSTVTSKSVTATGTGVDINAARLRATWLLACMNAPVPLNALLSAAGLKSARTLTDLLAYCPPAEPEQVAVVLCAMDGSLSGGERR